MDLLTILSILAQVWPFVHFSLQKEAASGYLCQAVESSTVCFCLVRAKISYLNWLLLCSELLYWTECRVGRRCSCSTKGTEECAFTTWLGMWLETYTGYFLLATVLCRLSLVTAQFWDTVATGCSPGLAERNCTGWKSQALWGLSPSAAVFWLCNLKQVISLHFLFYKIGHKTRGGSTVW